MAVEEGLHGVAEALADGHEREQEVAAAGGRQVRQRRRHHRGAVPRGAAAPVHELQLLPHARAAPVKRCRRQTITSSQGLGFYKRQASVEQRFREEGEYLACLAGEETSEENAGMVPGGRRRRRGGGTTRHYERCVGTTGRGRPTVSFLLPLLRCA